MRHWQNAYPKNTLPALCTECTSVYNPRRNPGNEWCRELDLTCTSVKTEITNLKWDLLNQDIELDWWTCLAPIRVCVTQHSARSSADESTTTALKGLQVLRSQNSSGGRAGPRQAHSYDWLTEGGGGPLWPPTQFSPSHSWTFQLHWSTSMETVKNYDNKNICL